jgi:hypothetical protein
MLDSGLQHLQLYSIVNNLLNIKVTNKIGILATSFICFVPFDRTLYEEESFNQYEYY